MSIKKLPKIVRMLELEKKASPTRIASETGSDIRTTKEILVVAANLGLVEYNSLKVSGRTYSAYRLAPGYKKLLAEKKEAWK